MRERVGTMTTAENDPRPSEEAALDRAINSMDPILRASLQRDQKQRRRRVLIAGGILMAIVTMAVVCLLFNWGAANGTGSQPAANPDDSSRAQVLTDAGWHLWQQQKYADAEAKFEVAVSLDEKIDAAWNGLGWSQLNQGKTETAIKAFRRCVKLAPEHGAALNGLGQAHFVLRKYDAAERYFLKAKDAPAAQYGLMRLYLLQGKFNKAQKWLEKIEASAGPDELADLDSFRKAIAAKKVDGSLRRMIEPAERVEAVTNVAKPTQEGWQLFNQGKNEQAEAEFKRAIKIDKDHLPAINGLAFSLLNQGKSTEAKPMFERLLKKEPKHFGAMNGLARCLKSDGEIAEAIKVWKRMQKKLPGFNAATTGLGMTYFELEQYEEAIPYLEKMIAGAPGNSSFSKMLETAKSKLK
jgi:tetratricopeptide (TPR) repeat protein